MSAGRGYGAAAAVAVLISACAEQRDSVPTAVEASLPVEAGSVFGVSTTGSAHEHYYDNEKIPAGNIQS